jgi:DNA-binding transcriptional MocR family regulator
MQPSYDPKGTRTTDVMKVIRARMASRAITAGDRPPSIRSFAATMGVSPSTVVEAYDRLVAEGLIRARRGSGFYVSATALPPLALAEDRPPRDRAVDPFWVSRQSLDADPAALKPGCGWLPADWMPADALRRALRALARAEDTVLSDYGVTRGSLALRRILMSRLAEESIEVSPDQLLLTASGTQAFDLICRSLLRPGQTVLVDDPCYFNFRALLRARGGFYLWCRLPVGCDSTDVARSALKENVVLAPGNVFSASQSAAAFMRFNVAHCGDPRVMPILQRAMKR